MAGKTIRDAVRHQFPKKRAELIIRMFNATKVIDCLLYTSPSPRDRTRSRMPSSA